MLRIQNKKSPVSHQLVSAVQSGRRIDNYLVSQFKGLPKKRIYQMLRKGEVRVNGKRIKQDYRLQEGDKVRIPPITQQQDRILDDSPPAYLFDLLKDCVLYEDTNLLAINKPAGLVVHSGSGRSFGVIELLRHLREDDNELQLVHRLDRETSGILLLAKNLDYLRELQESFKNGGIRKHYTALLTGKMKRDNTKVEKPLERNIRRSGERLTGVSDTGKQALTLFKVKQKWHHMTLVDVEIKTGRTHQIRAHAQSIGHPVVGDDKYGDKAANKVLRQKGFKHLFLHAAELQIPQLQKHKPISIKAPLPDSLARFLKQHAE